MHGCSIFSAWTNHGHTRTHKTHHGLDLGEATTLSFILFSLISHGGYMSFCLGIFKLGVPKLRLLAFWRVITFCEDLQLRWGVKQSYNLCQELFNDMWHTTCTHVFHGDFKLLVVGSQIGTLTLDLSFGHNLCFKYSNESCKSILNI
jgi:hypothetical protein